MGDFNDFDFEEPYEQPDDPRERAAREYLDEFFSKNQKSVFFGNQLAVQNENEFFHWVTHRAVTGLVQDGLVKTEKRKLATGSDIKLFWHKRHRYYKRDAKRIVDLVDEYGSPTMCAAIGLPQSRWFWLHLLVKNSLCVVTTRESIELKSGPRASTTSISFLN